ncbi:MAG: preprotein translocase subunit YajC [Planctomycetaceae bacterium]
MLTFLNLIAEAAPAAPPQGEGQGGMMQMLLLFGPMIAIFMVINYLLVSRPQQRERDKHQEMLTSLKKNDRVVTAGGIIGTVVSLSEDKTEITLKVDDNARIKFRTEYVRGRLDTPSTGAADTVKSA